MSSQFIYIESESRIEPPCCTLGHSCACKTHARLLHKLKTQYIVGRSSGLSPAEVKKKLQSKPEHSSTSMKRNEYCVKDVDEIMSYIGGEDKPAVQKGNKKKHKKHRRIVKPSKEEEGKENLIGQRLYSEIAKKENIIDVRALVKEQENQDDSTEPAEDNNAVTDTEIESNCSETFFKKTSKPRKKNIKNLAKKPSLDCTPKVHFKSGKGEAKTRQCNQYLASGNNRRSKMNPSYKVDSEPSSDLKDPSLPHGVVGGNETLKEEVSSLNLSADLEEENKKQECNSEVSSEDSFKCNRDIKEDTSYSKDRIKMKKLKWIPIHSVIRSNGQVTPIGYWYYSTTDRQIKMYKTVTSNNSPEASFEELTKEIQRIQRNVSPGSMNGWMNFGQNTPKNPQTVDKTGWEVNIWPKLTVSS